MWHPSPRLELTFASAAVAESRLTVWARAAAGKLVEPLRPTAKEYRHRPVRPSENGTIESLPENGCLPRAESPSRPSCGVLRRHHAAPCPLQTRGAGAKPRKGATLRDP